MIAEQTSAPTEVWTPERIVIEAYEVFLDRSPTEAELNTELQLRSRGKPLVSRIVESIANSQESKNRGHGFNKCTTEKNCAELMNLLHQTFRADPENFPVQAFATDYIYANYTAENLGLTTEFPGPRRTFMGRGNAAASQAVCREAFEKQSKCQKIDGLSVAIPRFDTLNCRSTCMKWTAKCSFDPRANTATRY